MLLPTLLVDVVFGRVHFRRRSIETEDAMLPALQHLRRGLGFHVVGLRTKVQARHGSTIRACRR